MNGPRLLEDEIGRKLAEAERSGELRTAKGYGEPLQADAAWEQTPDSLRMPFKILKDAGVVPYEIELLNKRAALRREIDACGDDATRCDLLKSLSTLEQSISLRLEALRGRA